MRRNRKQIGLKIALLTTLFVSYQNCSGVHKQDSESAASSGGEATSGGSGALGRGATAEIGNCEPFLRESFEKDYYAFTSVNCASCHTSSGVGKSKFADPNRDFAWSQFKNMGTSGPGKIYNNGISPGHSGTSWTGPQNEPTLKAALDRFNNSILACKSGTGGILTKPRVLKGLRNYAENNIAASTTRFAWNLNADLESQSQVDYGEAFFMINVAKMANNSSYIIWAPAIRSYEKEVNLRSLSVYINGKLITTSTTYANLNKSVPPYSSEFSTYGGLSELASYIPFEVKADDYIQFSFESLEAK